MATLDIGGVLNISAKSGTDGRMQDYSYGGFAPWSTKTIKEIIIEEGVTYLGDYCFSGISLSGKAIEIIMPDSIVEIGDFIISNSPAIESVVLPKYLERAGVRCLYSLSIKSITITGNMKGISHAIGFYGSTDPPNDSLEHIYVNEGVTEIPASFSGSTNSVFTLHLPKTNNVWLRNRAFGYVKELIIENRGSLTGYGSYCLPKTYTLNFADLPDNIEFLGFTCLSDYSSLNINQVEEMLMRLKEVDDYGLENFSISGTLNWPETIPEIPNGCFSKSKITEINIPEGVTSIGDSAFADTDIRKINLPSTVSYIGSYAFDTKYVLQEVSLPDNPNFNVGFIPFNLSAESIYKVPKNFKPIFLSQPQIEIESGGNWVEAGEDTLLTTEGELYYMLKGNIIPEGTKEVYYLHTSDENVTSITFPGSVEVIHKEALYLWKKLKEVIINNPNVELINASNSFFTGNSSADPKIHIITPTRGTVNQVLSDFGYIVSAVDDLNWVSGTCLVSIDEEKCLHIAPIDGIAGETADYSTSTPPWYYDDFSKIIIEEGVTKINRHVFPSKEGKIKYFLNKATNLYADDLPYMKDMTTDAYVNFGSIEYSSITLRYQDINVDTLIVQSMCMWRDAYIRGLKCNYLELPAEAFLDHVFNGPSFDLSNVVDVKVLGALERIRVLIKPPQGKFDFTLGNTFTTDAKFTYSADVIDFRGTQLIFNNLVPLELDCNQLYIEPPKKNIGIINAEEVWCYGDYYQSTGSIDKFYWMSKKVDGNMLRTHIPLTAMIYCYEDSQVETWCMNNNRAYKYIK